MIRITGVSILKTRQEIDFGIPVTNRGHFSLPNKICEKKQQLKIKSRYYVSRLSLHKRSIISQREFLEIKKWSFWSKKNQRQKRGK